VKLRADRVEKTGSYRSWRGPLLVGFWDGRRDTRLGACQNPEIVQSRSCP
jgi:hypothetical protein